LVGWLAGWLVGWLVGWFVGWLVGWLVDWLVVACDLCMPAIIKRRYPQKSKILCEAEKLLAYDEGLCSKFLKVYLRLYSGEK
jgi:hypothetical protein